MLETSPAWLFLLHDTGVQNLSYSGRVKARERSSSHYCLETVSAILSSA